MDEVLIRIKRLERRVIFSVMAVMTLLCLIAFKMFDDRFFAIAGIVFGIGGIIEIIYSEVQSHKENLILKKIKADKASG